MLNVGITVGINTDAISEENFPNWLEDIDDKTFNLSKEKWDDNYYGLGSDIAVAYYVKKFCNSKCISAKAISVWNINIKSTSVIINQVKTKKLQSILYIHT